ncbi:MAG TPA: hypothetical protein VHG88_15265, partial [Burkholderiales bacterium]|nr:hypothetical protein [Burkholderiales bacterium]
MAVFMALLLAAAPVFAGEALRVVESRELPVSQTAGDASHRLDLTVHLFRGGRWSQETVADAVLEAGGLLRQCAIALSRVELRVVQAPPRFRVYWTPLSRELLARLPTSRPAIFFVDDTRNDPAFDAEAIGRGNSAGRPELAGTVWVAYGARDLPQVLAHELAHLLADSGRHSEAPDNLMRAETSPASTR